MSKLTRIDPGSAFKVFGALYALLGILIGAVFSLIGFLGLSATSEAGPLAGAFFGAFAIVFFPILYGIIGAIGAAIGALLYNWIAQMVGGLDVSIE